MDTCEHFYHLFQFSFDADSTGRVFHHHSCWFLLFLELYFQCMLLHNLQNKCLDAQTVISLAFHVRSFARMCGMCARGCTYAALHEFLRGFKVLVGMFSFHLAWGNLACSTDQTQIRSQLCTCALERCLTYSQTPEMKNLCSAKRA